MVREVWTFLVLVIFYHYFSSNFILFSSRFFLSQFLTSSRRLFIHDFLLRYHLRYHHKYVTTQVCAFIKCLGFDKNFFDRAMLNVDFENLRFFFDQALEVFNGMFPKLYAKNCPGMIPKCIWFSAHPIPSHL